MNLSEKQWDLISSLLAKKIERPYGKGRPAQDGRKIVNGILWICRTAGPWKDLPGRYVTYQTCHRYFQCWVKSGTWEKILRSLAADLKDRGKIDISECFVDGSFASAKKGSYILEKLSGVKAPRSWRSQTLLVFLSLYGPPEPTHMK